MTAKTFTEEDLRRAMVTLKHLAKDDPEQAAILERELYRKVLDTIAYASTRVTRKMIQGLAAQSLAMDQVEFPRYSS